jgi:hypothetical protein
MSHTTIIQFQVKDWDLLQAVCDDIHAPCLIGKQVISMFSSNKVNAFAKINLPGWKFPIAITEDGELMYDHWGAKPDTMQHLVTMRNEYTLRLAEKTAGRQRRRSRRVTRADRPDWQFVEVTV